MIQWWYSNAGQAVGPYDVNGLAQAFRAGTINGLTLVWHEGMPNWLAINQLPELRGVVMPVQQAAAQAPRSNSTGIVLGIVGVLVAGVVLVIALAVWKGYRKGQAELAQAQTQPQATSTASQATRVWQNPVTLLQAYVDDDWQIGTTQISSLPAYTFQLPGQVAGIMTFATPENVSSSTLNDVVPEVARNLRNSGFQLDGTGQYTEDEALPGWLLTGSSRQYPDKKITVQIVQTKKNFWMILTYTPVDTRSVKGKLDQLHRAIISTIT